ncbi:Peripheral-type benzodiazepine receptor-associated protein 1 [Pseudolycoriella hygida]|uniref:Peripheral-type benzodiazepine receptor-associated protein 1 n=1 Tax=Pseudolycoriella hygida TaxID=35572 RepID=A0A9Q0S8A8_9DIPT|nr:Peripheral-type benzodiazepine receptor-associated protein 1 [Pseudolycoriella hygida]
MTLQNPIWTLASPDVAEKNAFFAGLEADGKKVFVGRAVDVFGNYVPVKFVPEVKRAFYEVDGREESTDKIEYLSGDYEWVNSSSGASTSNAVVVNGFHIGRGVFNGNVVVGRIDFSKSNQLLATYGGYSINLSDYELLVTKAEDNSRVVQNSISNSSSIKVSEKQTTNSVTVESRSIQDRTVVREQSFNQQRYFEMLNRIQTLELELQTQKHERIELENRVQFEQGRVEDLSNKLKALRVHNLTLVKERTIFEERITTESTNTQEIQSKLDGVLIDNAFLLKKVSTLEEELKYERYQIGVINDRNQREGLTGSAVQTKIKNFEETIRTQQQRILELESTIENTNTGRDSLTQQIKSYETTIQNMKIQMESIIKKLQGSSGENDFLAQKLSLLTQNLSSYQFQLEEMSKKLQNSRKIIASAHADLARANAQVSKYQSALSSCYILNGELMTKMSGMSSMSQFQGVYDSRFDILNLSREFSVGTTKKSISFSSTSSLMEAAGSDSYVQMVKSTQENGIQ